MIHHGDSLEVLKGFESNSIDSLVCDPPYGLGKTTPENVRACLQSWLSGQDYQASGGGFMSKEWDAWVPSPNLWKEVYRVLKPGAHGLVFSGSRTEDLMSISLRLAGFEVRDRLVWLYFSGFPKSHDVSKAIDKKLGAKRIVIGQQKMTGTARRTVNGNSHGCAKAGESIERVETFMDITEPATEQAKKYKGFGTALKPAYEPIILIRKPLDGTIADNVLKHGVGGLNIDDCRIGTDDNLARNNPIRNDYDYVNIPLTSVPTLGHPNGRWPANILINEDINDPPLKRYFYCAKASKAEREAGLSGFELRKGGAMNGEETRPNKPPNHPMRANIHPTVKPLDLMRYLCRLITPKGGQVLDPFAGSGSTLCAAALEGFKPLGIERELEYIDIIKARLKHWSGGDYDYTPPEAKREPKSGEQLNLF